MLFERRGEDVGSGAAGGEFAALIMLLDAQVAVGEQVRDAVVVHLLLAYLLEQARVYGGGLKIARGNEDLFGAGEELEALG